MLTPSQSQIASDLHRFRVLRCGRRFGKTYLACKEIKGKVLYKPRNVTYFATCYDDKTEILTDKGWKFFSDLVGTELVASYKEGGLIFEKPQEYFEYDYDGEMIGIENANIDMLVTPNHRCLVKNHRKGDWQIKEAQEIENTWVYRFKKTCSWNGEKYSKEWARFWGWYISEGYARKGKKVGWQVVITQCKKEFFDDIRSTLKSCGLIFREDKRSNGGINFVISGNKRLTDKCLLLGKSHQKYIFDELRNADKTAIYEFLEAYWNGDGHYPKNNYDYKRAETKSLQLADDLQEVIVKIGYSANVKKINGRNLYSVSWLNKKFNEPLIRKNDYYRIKYKGKIYCVKVSSGIVFVRRSGKHYWSGNTYQQARDIAWEMLRKDLEGLIVSANESRLEMKIRVLNSTETSLLQLRGWEAVEAERGKRNDFIVLDEVASMRNFWAGWHEVLRPTLTDTKGEALFISTPSGYNHFYDLCNLELTDSDYKSFNFTTYDNPHIPVEEIEKAKKELSNEQFLQEYMASFQKTAGLVYKEFSRDKHLYSELPAGDYIQIAGIDPGFVHPAAVLDIKIDRHDNWFIEDEWSKTGRTDAQIADYVAALFSSNPVYPDPENAGFIKELIDRGVNVREVIKGKNSVVSGISKVREMLLTGRLKVNKKCVNTIAGFEMYVYDEKTDKEIPVKENDDEMDALRYAVLMHNVSPEVSKKIREQFDISEARIRQDTCE